MAYAKELTREYLQKIGITEVTEDGRIFKGDKELKQFLLNGYYMVNLYDKELRQAINYEERKKNSGQFTVTVHRIVAAWWQGKVPAGYVVDHKFNDKTDNNAHKLAIVTPGENISKDRQSSILTIKCKLNKPRSFYEEKLNKYLEEYEQAKLMKDAKLCHKLRVNIYQTRARIRYYDTHKEAN